jgi:ABC-type antimicrobial peptide transport system permease subunit
MSAALMLRAALLRAHRRRRRRCGFPGTREAARPGVADRVALPVAVDLLRTSVAFVAVAVLASLLPLARLRRMDPLEAFRQ